MNFKHPNLQLVHLTLRLATFLLFAGRGWQHLFWDVPFRALLWDKELMEPVVLFFRGGTWQEYVTSAATDRFIQNIINGFGIFYAFMAVLTLLVRGKLLTRLAWLYILSSVSLAFLAFLYSKEKFYHVGQFFEYTIQFLLPLFFLYTATGRIRLTRLLLYMKIAIALTFTAHGLYALGIYPLPGVFTDMFITILGVSETTARQLLLLAGVLDFVVSVCLFIPGIAKYATLYAVLWGGLTALARTWGNFYPDFPLESLHQNLHETFIRMPHMLVPLAVLLIMQRARGTGHGAEGRGQRAEGREQRAESMEHRAWSKGLRAKGTGHGAQGRGLRA
jgi:hypothetical protein